MDHFVKTWAAWFAVVLLAGCPDLDLGEFPFLCGSDDDGRLIECPRGYDCLEGYCVRSGSNLPDDINGTEVVLAADAGQDQEVVVGETVQLLGTGSSEPSGLTLSYAWEQVSGTTVVLSNPYIAELAFTAPPDPSTLVFSLLVISGDVVSDPDTVTIEVVYDEVGPVCGDESEGCSFADFTNAQGDIGTGDVRLGETHLTATRRTGVQVAEVADGCFFVTSMLADASRAQLSQTFRVPADYDGRVLEGIDVGPLNWWQADGVGQGDTIGPDDATLTLTLMLPEGPVSVSHPTSVIGGVSVRFDFSPHRVLLRGGEIYEFRLSTDLPSGHDPRIAWLVVAYQNPSCLDGDGEMRHDADPATSLRYCASGGSCSAALSADGVFRVDAAPRASVILGDGGSQALSASTLDAEVNGLVLFDLHVDEGEGGWEARLVGVELFDLIDSGVVGERFRVDMSFVERPAWVSCLRSCLANTLPIVEILSGPPESTRETSASVEFSCDEADCEFQCSIDAEPFAACSSPFRAEDIEDGDHTLSVRASRNGEGRYGPTTGHTWRVDTVVPNTSFVSTPADPTYDTTAVFEFECDKDTCRFECSLDDGVFEACDSPQTVTALAVGAHSFAVRAADLLESVGPTALFNWTIREVLWIDVTAGRGHVCAIRDDHTLWCWGENGSGQLGDGTQDQRTRPSKVGQEMDWLAVAAGDYFTCGLREPGELWCWGANDQGQTGIGLVTPDNAVLDPTRVGEGDAWKKIAAGGWHACAIDAQDEIWCWGYNLLGQVGDGSQEFSRPQPTQVAEGGPWEAVSAGYDHSCAMKEGSAWCWGRNIEGQIGDGEQADARAPVLVNAPGEVASGEWLSVAPGGLHTCAIALAAESGLFCWGDGGRGQTGQGVEVLEPARVPLRVPPESEPPMNGWSFLSSGYLHSCGIREGQAFCWGANELMQAGREEGGNVLVPLLVQQDEPSTSFVRVAAGGKHSCALDDLGAILCWGSNAFGQLGDGEVGGSRHIPTRIVR